MLWTLGEIVFIVLLFIFVRRFKIRSQHVAIFGFILLFLTMIFSLLNQDVLAGKTAEFVWIVFVFVFFQDFYHFLRHENK